MGIVVFGLLAFVIDIYFSVTIAAVMGAYYPTNALTLVIASISTRLIFIIEEGLVTRFNPKAYMVAVLLSVNNIIATLACGSLDAAIAVTLFTGLILLCTPPVLKFSKP